MNLCTFSSRGRNDQWTKWPGDEMTGDEMTGDELYEGTKWPGQNDRVRNERGRSVMPPIYLCLELWFRQIHVYVFQVGVTFYSFLKHPVFLPYSDTCSFFDEIVSIARCNNGRFAHVIHVKILWSQKYFKKTHHIFDVVLLRGPLIKAFIYLQGLFRLGETHHDTFLCVSFLFLPFYRFGPHSRNEGRITPQRKARVAFERKMSQCNRGYVSSLSQFYTGYAVFYYYDLFSFKSWRSWVVARLATQISSLIFPLNAKKTMSERAVL
jgi:hypothetical protein